MVKEVKTTKITFTENGPIMVEGPVTMEGQYGNKATETRTIFLCRCGGSSNKPFCDGTHQKINFKG